MNAAAAKNAGQPPDALSQGEAWGWTRAHQLSLAILLAVLLVLLAVQQRRQSAYWHRTELRIEHTALPDYRIDANTADFASLTRLPGLGPAKVRRLLAYRTAFEKAHPGQPAFVRLADLRRIRGFGKDTLDKISPFLRFASAAAATHPAVSTRR